MFLNLEKWNNISKEIKKLKWKILTKNTLITKLDWISCIKKITKKYIVKDVIRN